MCDTSTCDHMTRTGHAYVYSNTAGDWHIRTAGGHTSGGGGRPALEDALRREGLEPRDWRTLPAGFDEIRELPAAVGGTFRGHVPVFQDACTVWALDWSHAPD